MNIEDIYTFWRTAKKTLHMDGLLSSNELHIYIGLIAYLFTLYLLRRTKFPALYAFSFVVILQSLNELIDSVLGLYAHAFPNMRMTALDFAVTLILPLGITVLIYVWKRVDVTKTA